MSTLARRSPALFSLGAVVRLCWHPDVAAGPWIFAASALTGLALWDYLARAGRVYFILLGLAGYELIVGLTE